MVESRRRRGIAAGCQILSVRISVIAEQAIGGGMSKKPLGKPTITARDILAALAEIKRRGRWPLFQQLEHQEPDLTEHLLEELTSVHRTLVASGAPAKVTRRLQRQMQRLVLVVVIAIRNSTNSADSGSVLDEPP
jgi:hypothetical protein